MSNEIRIVTTSEKQAEELGERLYISMALEDALCELVALKGIGFLDEFYERRVRRMGDQFSSAAAQRRSVARPEVDASIGDIDRLITKAGEKALKDLCERVERDPKPAT